MTEEVRKAACWFCYQNCGLLIKTKGGVIQSIEGDPFHPVNLAGRCPRPYGWKEFHEHTDRINVPLRRTGKRGENKWQRISWDEALDAVAAKLKEIREKYGAEAVASSGGTNRTDDWARRRFFNLFGSPNIFHIDAICGLNNFVIETAIYGWVATPEIYGSCTIVVWGHNPAVSYLPLARGIIDAKESGAKIIVIDPRFTETASKADLWLQVRPNTDVALALAWMNVIIEDGLYDKDFVENFTIGFSELSERVKQFTPEWAERITWVPKAKIVESAHLYATNKPSCLTWGVALDHQGINAGVAAQSKAILRAITGNLDCEGGNVIGGPHPSLITDEELELNDALPEVQRNRQLGSDRFKLMSWPGYEILRDHARHYWGKAPCAERTCQAHPPTVWRAISSENPYPVKALITVANNPLLAFSNTKLVHEALTSDNLELYVIMDYFMTPSALLADYVFPAASWLERPVLSSFFGLTDWFIASERPIQPTYERKTDYEFWRGLGIRLDQAQHWTWESLEAANSYRLTHLGYNDYEKFVHEQRLSAAPKSYRRYAKKGFGTPSGKVELRSSILEKLGYDPLPHYEEPPESPLSAPMAARQFPLILVAGGNFLPYHHSEQRQIRILRKFMPDPLAEIHPSTAMKYGVAEGDWIYIETKRGKIKQRAKLSSALDPRVVVVQKGWWFPEQSVKGNLLGLWESNANILTDDDPDRCDPICGSWYYRGLLCKIYKTS